MVRVVVVGGGGGRGVVVVVLARILCRKGSVVADTQLEHRSGLVVLDDHANSQFQFLLSYSCVD